ncbi:MAG: hypothetical protein V1721_04465 [Pseudomonadota bacterium]
MKRFLFAALLLVSTPAMAEDFAAPTAPPPNQAAAANEIAAGPKMSFEERKAKVLKRMDERIADIQKSQACIQAAETPEALETCFPDTGKLRPMMEGRGGRGGRDDMPVHE